MNGRSEERLIASILDQIKGETSRERQEIRFLMQTLMECVHELSALRKRTAEAAGCPASEIRPAEIEMNAREVLAKHLVDVTEEEREGFRIGKLDPNGLRLSVSRFDADVPEAEHVNGRAVTEG